MAEAHAWLTPEIRSTLYYATFFTTSGAATVYGGIWFAKRSHQLPAKVDGHTDYCEAVTSFPQGGFIRDGRAGGVLLFANPRFGAQWAALNGVVPG